MIALCADQFRRSLILDSSLNRSFFQSPFRTVCLPLAPQVCAVLLQSLFATIRCGSSRVRWIGKRETMMRTCGDLAGGKGYAMSAIGKEVVMPNVALFVQPLRMESTS